MDSDAFNGAFKQPLCLSLSPESDSDLNIAIPFNNNTLPRTDCKSSGLQLLLTLSFGC